MNEKNIYEEKIIEVKRVTKVVTGGKKLTFKSVVVVGNKKNKVGVGVGRAEDVNLSLEKAVINARKNMIIVPISKNFSIPSITTAIFSSSKVLLIPTFLDTGISAGSSIRAVLELGGFKNILAKQQKSNNKLNNAKATIIALKNLKNQIELNKFRKNSNKI